jgi:hypothetical protein
MLAAVNAVLFAIALFPLYTATSYAEESCEGLPRVGDRVGIKFHVTNYQLTEPIATIVQIKDSNDVTVQLSWLLLVMEPDQKMDVIQSWIPEAAGQYTAEVFVWYDLDNPRPLIPGRELALNVNC